MLRALRYVRVNPKAWRKELFRVENGLLLNQDPRNCRAVDEVTRRWS